MNHGGSNHHFDTFLMLNYKLSCILYFVYFVKYITEGN